MPSSNPPNIPIPTRQRQIEEAIAAARAKSECLDLYRNQCQVCVWINSEIDGRLTHLLRFLGRRVKVKDFSLDPFGSSEHKMQLLQSEVRSSQPGLLGRFFDETVVAGILQMEKNRQNLVDKYKMQPTPKALRDVMLYTSRLMIDTQIIENAFVATYHYDDYEQTERPEYLVTSLQVLWLREELDKRRHYPTFLEVKLLEYKLREFYYYFYKHLNDLEAYARR